MPVIPHLGSPTAIGLAANLHWAAAAGCELVEFDIYPDLPARDGSCAIRSSRSTDADGMIAVPDGPGLGIDIDEAAFENLPYEPGATYAEIFLDHERPGAFPNLR